MSYFDKWCFVLLLLQLVITVMVKGTFIKAIYHTSIRRFFSRVTSFKKPFTKHQHRIRCKDLEHKDKQNFEAVSRITAQCVLDLLEQFPDAKRLQYFVDTYLNKTLSPLQQIYKAWYVGLLRDKKHTVRNNFITYNAHACTELNGHDLILFC